MGMAAALLVAALLVTGGQGQDSGATSQARAWTSPFFSFFWETSSWSQPLYSLLTPVLASCQRTTSLLTLQPMQDFIQIYCSSMQPRCSAIAQSAAASSLCQTRAVASVVADLCRCGVRSFWSAWSEWGQCACADGSGVRTRSRACTGGGACDGVPIETAVCDSTQCPAAPADAAVRCATPNFPRIIGGVEAALCEFPTLVGIHALNDEMPRCGGIIVNRTTILTAAHCVFGDMEIYAGKHRTNATEEEGRPLLQNIRVASTVIHPSYNGATYNHDVALLTLSSELLWSTCVQPACLPDLLEKADLTAECFSAGWGTTTPPSVGTRATRPEVLMKVAVTGYELNSCRSAFPFYTRAFPTAGLCAAGDGKDTCIGDSGGPLLCKSTSGLYKAFGIVSNGDGCAQAAFPGIYMEVAYYINFLRYSSP